MSSPTVTAGKHGATFAARVQPGSPRNKVAIDETGRVKLKIDAPPVDGEANTRLIQFLAREVFGVPRASVQVIAGEKGRNKTIAVDLDVEAVRAALIKAAE